MEDSANLDQLTLRLDENEELNALTLTTLLNSGVEEALSNLSPAQLIQLEKNVQKLKKQKTPITPLRKRVDADSSAVPEKKRKASPASEEDLAGHASRSTGGQYMNLPASAPHVEIRDGIEWLLFTYSTKGHIQEYCIRIDIDDLTLDEIPTDFKNDNCVYPRALVIRDSYSGNRFEYESSVNDLAWKLTWMNADVLSGKRGLIQRAVDSYRNRTPESRSRRVLRQQKLQEGNLRRRSTSEHDVPADGKTQKSITLQYTSKNGETSRIKLRVDIDSVNLADLDDDFRRANCLYPQAACDQSNYGTGRYEYESSCNEIAWKLTWLNAGKLANQPNILQKAVDAYRARFETGKHHEYFSSGDHASIHAPADGLLTKGADFSEMVAHTLQQVLGHAQDDEIHSQVSLEDHLATSHNFKDDDDDDDDFDHPRTVSTAELLGGL